MVLMADDCPQVKFVHHPPTEPTSLREVGPSPITFPLIQYCVRQYVSILLPQSNHQVLDTYLLIR